MLSRQRITPFMVKSLIMREITTFQVTHIKYVQYYFKGMGDRCFLSPHTDCKLFRHRPNKFPISPPPARIFYRHNRSSDILPKSSDTGHIYRYIPHTGTLGRPHLGRARQTVSKFGIVCYTLMKTLRDMADLRY